MRKISLFTVALLFFTQVPTHVSSAQYEDFIYEDNGDGTATIVDYVGSGGHVSMPASIRGLSVTRVGSYAFEGKNLTGVDIPDGLTHIEDGAFAYNSIKAIDFPESVVYIGIEAFDTTRSRISRFRAV